MSKGAAKRSCFVGHRDYNFLLAAAAHAMALHGADIGYNFGSGSISRAPSSARSARIIPVINARGERYNFSYPLFKEVRDRGLSFSGVFAVLDGTRTMDLIKPGPAQTEKARCTSCPANTSRCWA